jgi:hypothetical protein
MTQRWFTLVFSQLQVMVLLGFLSLGVWIGWTSKPEVVIHQLPAVEVVGHYPHAHYRK